MGAPFALWLTGLPACGKSTIARELVAALHKRGVHAAHLESDVLRTQITPFPRYDEAERELFYAAMVELGAFLCGKNVPVVFDATGNRRAYRDAARSRIARFADKQIKVRAVAVKLCLWHLNERQQQCSFAQVNLLIRHLADARELL